MHDRQIDKDRVIPFEVMWVELDPKNTNDADHIRKICEEFDGAVSLNINGDDELGLFWIKCFIPQKLSKKFIEKLQEPRLIN